MSLRRSYSIKATQTGDDLRSGSAGPSRFLSRVPVCTILKVGVPVAVGAGAVAATPFVLGAVGFTAAGVAAGSIAASLQGPAVASGSLFAICQSVGAAGLGAGGTAGVFSAGCGAGWLVTLLPWKGKPKPPADNNIKSGTKPAASIESRSVASGPDAEEIEENDFPIGDRLEEKEHCFEPIKSSGDRKEALLD